MKNISRKRNGQREEATPAKNYVKAIVGTIHEPLLVLNEDLKVVFANNNFYTAFKVSEEGTEGRLVYELGDNEWNIPALRTLLEEVLPEKKNFFDFEVTHEFKSIGRHTMLVNANQLIWEEGEEKLILLAFRDLTQHLQDWEGNELYLKRIRDFFMQAPAAIAMVSGPEHTYTLANPLYKKVFNRSGQNILGKTIKEVFPEIGGQGIYELFDTVFESGEAYVAHEFPAKFDRSGQGVFETGYFNFIAHPIKDIEGNVSDIMIHAFEITEQVLARKKVEESEQQVRSLIENAPFPIAVYEGKEMKITFANQAIINVWGKGDNIIGKLCHEILPELDNQEVFDQLARVYSTGIAFHAENQHLDLVIDGALKPFYFNYSFTPLWNASGEVYGIMNTAADVTELNLGKKKIEASEHRYQEMIYSSPSLIATFKGKDHIIEIANDAILESWGKGRDVIGKPLLSVLPEIIEQGLGKILQEVYETGKPTKVTKCR